MTPSNQTWLTEDQIQTMVEEACLWRLLVPSICRHVKCLAAEVEALHERLAVVEATAERYRSRLEMWSR